MSFSFKAGNRVRWSPNPASLEGSVQKVANGLVLVQFDSEDHPVWEREEDLAPAGANRC